jgi:hypothetical protein
MAIESILSQIDAEIARLNQVRSLLTNSVGDTVHLPEGNGKGSSGTRKKHVLSPEARKRIADAQRRRWAAQKARGNK